MTPACLLLRELAAVAGIALPLIQVFCPMWLIFYVFGLDWRRWAALIEGRTTQLVAVLFIFLNNSGGRRLLVVFDWRFQYGHNSA